MASVLSKLPGWTWRKLLAWLEAPRLPLKLALIAMVLSCSALPLGFYLDELVGRYIYSDREGAARLFHNHSGGFGFALGDPTENHWLMEQGWAPWWLHEHMRFAGYRPISVLLHQLDFRFLFDSAPLMRVHSLLWLGAMVVAVAGMYRVLLPPAVAGAAALLFALDHTHGFEVGYIMNRHSLVSTALCALLLAAHFRCRERGRARDAWQGPLLYVLALFTSELSVSVCAYVVAYELLVREDGPIRRQLAAAPYLVITLVWAAWYKAAGFGAAGTDFYIDPGLEPLHYLRAFAARGPLLLLGQFAGPPAELYYGVSDALGVVMVVWAWLVIALVAWVLWPLLRRDRIARFWCLGMLGCLLPAAGPDANNRQLLFVSLGALGVLAQAWQWYAQPSAAAAPRATWAAGLLIGFRLFVSPLLLPVMTITPAAVAPMNTVAANFLREPYAGRDLIFVTAPYSYVVRVVQLYMRLSDAPLPRHIRYLSMGAKSTTLRRTGPQTLEVELEDGLFSNPELRADRDRHIAMPRDTTVQLEGFRVTVLEDAPDAGPTRVRFSFDKPLEDPSFAWYRWGERGFVPFEPPPQGAQVRLPGAVLPMDLQ